MNPIPRHVPTLTEVIASPVSDLPNADVNSVDSDLEGKQTAITSLDVVLDAALPIIDEARLTQQVLAQVQRHIDLMLEYRLREALAGALARASDVLVNESRDALAATLRDVVSRAVAQELARQRAK